MSHQKRSKNRENSKKLKLNDKKLSQKFTPKRLLLWKSIVQYARFFVYICFCLFGETSKYRLWPVYTRLPPIFKAHLKYSLETKEEKKNASSVCVNIHKPNTLGDAMEIKTKIFEQIESSYRLETS